MDDPTVGVAAKITNELIGEASEDVKKEGDEVTPPEPSAGEAKPPEPEVKEPSAGDVKPGTEGTDGGVVTPPPSTETPPADPGKTPPPEEPKTVPYDRLQEVISERNTERERVDTLTALLTKVATREESATKKETKEVTKSLDDVVKELDLDPQEAKNLEAVVNSVLNSKGVAESAKVTELENTVKGLTDQQNQQATQNLAAADAKQKAEAIKKYEGVVTVEELDAALETMRNSTNPQDRSEYDHSSYEAIIKDKFSDKILETAVNKAMEAKLENPPVPPVDTGKAGEENKPKTPEPPDDLIEPGQGGVAETLASQMMSEISKPGE